MKQNNNHKKHAIALNARESGLFGSFLLAVDGVHRQTSKHQNSSSPLSTGELISEIEDGCHNCKELPRRRNDGAGQRTVVGYHSENEELKIWSKLFSCFIT